MNDPLLCGKCAFFDGNRKEPIGVCRRFPPQSPGLLPQAGLDGKVTATPTWYFPLVRPKVDWCGEFTDLREGGQQAAPGMPVVES